MARVPERTRLPLLLPHGSMWIPASRLNGPSPRKMADLSVPLGGCFKVRARPASVRVSEPNKPFLALLMRAGPWDLPNTP
jgi:hypothetical protein